jgi:hypothetical protein
MKIAKYKSVNKLLSININKKEFQSVDIVAIDNGPCSLAHGFVFFHNP